MAQDEFTLLVVDDAEMNRRLLSRRLGECGYRVLAAENGPRALELFEQERVDLVLLDIVMPGMTGLEVLYRIRREASPSELPVIIASALTESDDMVEGLEAGANDYVTKPFDFRVLLARVKTQLRGIQRRRVALVAGEIGTGTVLEERYRLDSVIGSGSFGAVFRGTHLGLDSEVAIKILQAPRGNVPEARERFRKEGISACRVTHPNAVRVHDFGVTDEGVSYLVMELLEGHSLEAELRQDGRLDPRRCGEIVVPVCEVLAQAHSRGVIHRDIKPANIFLHRGPRGEIVKVLDFGIAKLADDAAGGNATVEGSVLGTPAYMAPERFSKHRYGGSADIYSLGVTLFQMLAGRQPFELEGVDLPSVMRMQIEDDPDPLAEIRPELPQSLVELVHRCLCKSPADRPDARELAHRLAEAVGMEIDWPGVAESFKRDLEELALDPETAQHMRTRSSSWMSQEEEEATESMLLSTAHEESAEIRKERKQESVLFDLSLDEEEVSSLLSSLGEEKD